MSHVVERNLFEKPILFVSEEDQTYAYQRGFTTSGLPYYTAPPEKHKSLENQMDEVLFLPISNKDFEENKEDMFFGFRFVLTNNCHNTMSLMNNAMAAITQVQLQYEISRFRYYPDGEKTVHIDKIFDSMFPVQLVNMRFHSSEVGMKLLETINDVINSYCNFYVDRKI